MITIIPAIDIIDGKCVRLAKGDFSTKKIYSSDPLDVAKRFEDQGIKRLHLVDLDGARSKRIVNHHVLETIAKGTGLVIDFGGGLQSDNDLEIAFKSGAAQVTAGSIAVRDKSLVLQWLKKYGADKIILGSDIKNGFIAISGWQEQTKMGINDYLSEYRAVGVKTIICTDIDRDGVLKGPAFDLYQHIKKQFPSLELIASGGISSVRDVERLNSLGINGVIIGKALYEGQIKIEELKPFLC